jgi:hypothetical protein
MQQEDSVILWGATSLFPWFIAAGRRVARIHM